MDSQFGIAHVWTQGDFVTRAVAIILLAMSVASWLVMIIKALDIVKFKKLARNAQDFWHSPDLASGLEKLGDDRSNPFRYLVLEGREATAHHRKTSAHLHDTLDISDWVTRCMRNGISEFTARLQSGLAILASVGSTAPFIGLFGTVWGIYHALVAIGLSGQSSIDKVAGPIGEALIMTDRKSTRLNSSHLVISYAVFCLKKKKKSKINIHYHHVITTLRDLISLV